MKFNSAFLALNHLENGGRVAVCLPGFISSIFEITGEGIKTGNVEIGFFVTDKTKGDILTHFDKMLKEGGELVAA